MTVEWRGLKQSKEIGNGANGYFNNPDRPNEHMFFVHFHNSDRLGDEAGHAWWDAQRSWQHIKCVEDIPIDIVRKLHTYGFTYRNEEEEARIMSSVSKLLSTGLLVSSTDFAKLTPAKQTEVLVSAAGKPIVFVDSFASLRNKRNLVSRLVNGEDVTTELEFNEITLSDDDKKVLEALRPILERIRGAAGKYPWMVRTADQERTCKSNIAISGTEGSGRRLINRSGYRMTEKQGEKIWNAASAYWAGGDKPKSTAGEFDGYRKNVTYNEENVVVGCQTVQRYEVEYIAEQFGWEPNIEGKEVK